MADNSTNHLDDDNDDDDQETLSLTDFPTTNHDDLDQDHHHHHRKPSSSSSSTPSATEQLFEFFHGGFHDFSQENIMSHAEDIIFCGKLIPINQQQKPHHKNQLFQQQSNHCRRSESLSELKSTAAAALTDNRLVRNSRSLDYKKLYYRNSSVSSEPAPDIHRTGSGKKPSSFRWCVLMFGLLKVPPEMDLRDIKNRQIRRSTSKSLFPTFDSGDVSPVNRAGDDRKSSWGILGFLSCKTSASVAVTTPLDCLPKV